MNVIFFCSGSGGDVYPFLRLASRLKGRGHTVGLVSHCQYAKVAARAGLDFGAVDSPQDYAAYMDDSPLLNTPRGIPEFLRRHSFPNVLRAFDLIRQRSELPETLLVTQPVFDTVSRIAAEKLRIPLIWAFLAPVQVTASALRAQLFGRVLAPDIDALRAQLNLSPVADWEQWLCFPERNIALWPDWFAAPDASWPAAVEPVGFLKDDPAESANVPAEAKEALADRERPILITSGTGSFLTSDFYQASLGGCELLGLPVLIVTPYKKLLPARLPDRATWFERLPFPKIMPHVRAVIHHGGIGTIGCAIASGVPQMVLASGADRPDNGARLQRLGIGGVEPPPRWKPDRVASALQLLLGSPGVRNRCKQLAERQRATDAAAAACEIVENIGALRYGPTVASQP